MWRAEHVAAVTLLARMPGFHVVEVSNSTEEGLHLCMLEVHSCLADSSGE